MLLNDYLHANDPSQQLAPPVGTPWDQNTTDDDGCDCTKSYRSSSANVFLFDKIESGWDGRIRNFVVASQEATNPPTHPSPSELHNSEPSVSNHRPQEVQDGGHFHHGTGELYLYPRKCQEQA